MKTHTLKPEIKNSESINSSTDISYQEAEQVVREEFNKLQVDFDSFEIKRQAPTHEEYD